MGDAYDQYEDMIFRRQEKLFLRFDAIELREERRAMARKPKGSVDPTATGTSMGKIITPEQVAASGTEHGHQAAIFQWIALVGCKVHPELRLLFAVPNGGDRRASVAASMKAEGVKSGIPDMILPVPMASEIDKLYERSGCHGLYLELKRPGLEKRKNGDRSDNQVQWHKDLRKQGYAVATAYGWQAAAWVLHLYLRDRLIMPDGDDCFMATACEEPPKFD